MRNFPEISGSCHHPLMCCDVCLEIHIAESVRLKKDLKCPFSECQSKLVYKDMKRLMDHRVIAKSVFERYANDLLDATRATRLQFIWCVNRECGETLSGSDSQPQLTCYRCHTVMCYKHETLWHQGNTCDQVEEETMKQKAVIHPTLYLSLSSKNCPKCATSVERSSARYRMHCNNCSYEFFWCCLRNYRDKEAARLHRHHCEKSQR